MPVSIVVYSIISYSPDKKRTLENFMTIGEKSSMISMGQQSSNLYFDGGGGGGGGGGFL
jgi:hypothetical protein